MSAAYSPSSPPSTPVPGGSASLADGDWHRMHPLTPLFKGGLALIVIAGIVFANMRDRLIAWAIAIVTPEDAHLDQYAVGYPGDDPVGWVLENNLVLVALLGVVVVAAVLVLIFWIVWRFQQFRITGDDVEVRKGIVFRSRRRAPLDRVQGVNLTRPFPARIIGLAKLEVVGAGTDANVPLEYLATARAESVRADILRLASGARAARNAAMAAREGVVAPNVDGSGSLASATAHAKIIGSVNEGVTGLIEGVDLADVAPESVMKIPAGRLIGARLLDAALALILLGIGLVALSVSISIGMSSSPGPEDVFAILGLWISVGVPGVITVAAVTWAQIARSLRYSIAPTADGVRITYGLLTTVTETLPPGRIFAVEVSQSLLWRPFGWWTVRINRMSGKSVTQQQTGTAQQFNTVLPVGKRADVERVLALILPDAPVSDISLVWEHGILGPIAADPYRTIPRRASWRRPLSWKRHGYCLTDVGLLLRRGVIGRKLAIFPLARMQGIALSQGPIDRAQRVARARVHSVLGPVTGRLSGLERADALALVDTVNRAAAAAAARDHTHRWGEHPDEAGGVKTPTAAPPAAGWSPPPPAGWSPPPPPAWSPPPPPASPGAVDG